MAVNAKLGVDLSSFEQGIRTGQTILKSLNAEMKATEAEFKATGNAEKQLSDKTRTLNSTLQAQKGIADQAKQALKAMDEAGVQPTDAAYQKLYATMMNATAGMNNAQAELNALGSSAQEAAAGADQLTTSVQSIGKKISLDQVITGIDRITNGLESAARKAVDFGKQLWDAVMDSAAQADDISTMATKMGLTDDQVQRMMYVADSFEAPVEMMAKTWKKVKMSMTSDSDDVAKGFERLGISIRESVDGDNGSLSGGLRNYLDVFWEVGEALMGLSDSSEQERLATTLLGRSWDELVPLFTKGREAYETAMDAVTPATEKAVENSASLNDRVKELEKSWDMLKIEVIGAVAPALEKGADALAKVLDQLTAYLQSEDGQKLLEGLGTAVSGLFEDLGKINAKDVVENFTNVFNGLVTSLQWIVANKNELISALEAVVVGWGGLKVTGGVLTIIKMLDGLRELGIIGGGSAAGTASGFASGISTAMAGGATISLNNMGVVGDWLTHESPLGAVFQGTETLGAFISRTIGGFKDRAASFWSDWANNPLISMWSNYDSNKDAATRLPEGADWRPSYMKDIGPVPVETEPVAPDGAAQDLSSQIGTVTVPVDFVPSSVDWRPSYMQGFGHANGLSFVPYDGYLARLHKGERVVPAREIQSRSYNSNLYVESMIMNNGTDAAGLASAMAAAQQRTMIGFGS